MRNSVTAIAVGFTLLMEATSASAVPIYNGLSTPHQTPDQQGWLYLSGTHPFTVPPPTPVPSAKASSGGTILNSGKSSYYSGYFYNYPWVNMNLDRSTGYSISFSVKINSEKHLTPDRAGFSIIVISDTLPDETQPYGIELAFWQDKVWAQDVNFKHAEEVSFNNQANGNNYNLYVKDDQYQLFANGSTTPILQGKLRQYPPPPGFPMNPYNKANLIFMGDDTSSATAKFTIRSVNATPVTQSSETNTASQSGNSKKIKSQRDGRH